MLLLADHGLTGALPRIRACGPGINIRDGKIVNAAVVEALESG